MELVIVIGIDTLAPAFCRTGGEVLVVEHVISSCDPVRLDSKALKILRSAVYLRRYRRQTGLFTRIRLRPSVRVLRPVIVKVSTRS